jgi:hypothetical protein
MKMYGQRSYLNCGLVTENNGLVTENSGLVFKEFELSSSVVVVTLVGSLRA